MANNGGVWSLDLTAVDKRLGWTSLNDGGADGTGGLRISELLSLSFDQLNAVLLGGAQDNGSFELRYSAVDGIDNNGDGRIDDPSERYAWIATSSFGGDGNGSGVIPVDTDGDGRYDAVLRLVLGNNLRFFAERFVGSGGQLIDTPTPWLGANTANQEFDVTGVIPGGTQDTAYWQGPDTNPVTNLPYLVTGVPYLLGDSNVPVYIEITEKTAALDKFRLHQFAAQVPLVTVTDRP